MVETGGSKCQHVSKRIDINLSYIFNLSRHFKSLASVAGHHTASLLLVMILGNLDKEIFYSMSLSERQG